MPGEGHFLIGLHEMCLFRVSFLSENSKPGKKFAINSQTGYNFYDDFLKIVLEDSKRNLLASVF